YYAVQTASRPPTLDLFVNSNRDLPESYRRFLENQLRSHTGLVRSPLRLNLRSPGGETRHRKGRARA
ncbi:MAG: ribosome biogenesis GTPase Der, partial [Acidobacteriota bacterium]